MKSVRELLVALRNAGRIRVPRPIIIACVTLLVIGVGVTLVLLPRRPSVRLPTGGSIAIYETALDDDIPIPLEGPAAQLLLNIAPRVSAKLGLQQGGILVSRAFEANGDHSLNLAFKCNSSSGKWRQWWMLYLTS